MTSRYFCEIPIQGDRVVLSGAEAHHLLHVMRAAADTEVVLFDGSGQEFRARIERTSRSEVTLTVLSCQEVDRELPLELCLGVALPKGDRQKWLVEKAVELGVRRIVPLGTARGVAQPVDAALARLRRSVIEASKQCGRNRLLEIAEPQAWSDFVGDAGGPCRLLAHPCNDTAAHGLSWPPRAQGVRLAVGPEGGLTEAEVNEATSAGWRLVDLGPRILRVETAAILLVALVVARPG